MLTPIGFDTETHPIRPGRQAPPVVCVQIGSLTNGALLECDRGLPALRALLLDPSVLLVGHAIAFDVLATSATDPTLLPLWLNALEADRVVCTLVREKLARIARARDVDASYALKDLLDRYEIPRPPGMTDEAKSASGVRVRFNEFEGLRAEEYPPDARAYALGDLVVLDVYHAQERKHPAAWFADQFRRTRGTVWLAATSAHGMRVDREAVAELTLLVEEEHTLTREILTHASEEAIKRFEDLHEIERPEPGSEADRLRTPPTPGIVRPVGTRDIKRAKARMVEVCTRAGLPVPPSPKGKEMGLTEGTGEWISLDADACLASGDTQLRAYARFTSIGTVRSRARRLALAAELGVPVQPRFDVLKKTGRTSATTGDVDPGEELLAIGDQTQNLPRMAGLRECYTARDGCVIGSADWKAAEMHTLSQTCDDFGLDSRLARVLRERDAHIDFAAAMLGKPYEWVAEALKGKHGPEAKKTAKNARQAAKACNFGFPGGLGIAKFRAWAAKTYGVIWTETEARRRKDQWLDAYPEMRQYFAIVDQIANGGQPFAHPKSMRYRGDLSYTSTANSFFQGRCADMLIDAGWRIFAWAHRTQAPVRIWNEAHDEILYECPESVAHEISSEIVRIMEAVGAEWCPIAPVKAEPALQRHWRKAAEPAYRGGRLIPHEDRDLTDEEIRGIREAMQTERPLRVAWRFGIELSRALEIAT